MKAYGKLRKQCANRNIKGTSIACPCCVPFGSFSKISSKSYKAKERRINIKLNRNNMNFIEAKKKLKENAGGKFHLLNYEIGEYDDGELKQECKLYIDELNYYCGNTWEEAFEKLFKVLNPTKQIVEIESIEEINAI